MIHKLWARFDHGLRDDQTLTGFYNLWNIKNELNSCFMIWLSFKRMYANNTSIQIPIKHIVKYAAEDFIQR